jgi:hypothetical protein
MRVNDKTLISLSGGTPDHSGLLFKRGEVNRSFQRRWCCVRGNLFFYFDKKWDKEPIGCVVLEGCRIEISDPESGLFTFRIAFTAPGRTYVLAAESHSDMEQWIRILSRANYDYLKFTAVELDSRLNDLRAAAASPGPAPIRPARNTDHCHSGRIPFTRRPFADVHHYYGRHWLPGHGSPAPVSGQPGGGISGETVPQPL